jgi:hypothetical protein
MIWHAIRTSGLISHYEVITRVGAKLGHE